MENTLSFPRIVKIGIPLTFILIVVWVVSPFLSVVAPGSQTPPAKQYIAFLDDDLFGMSTTTEFIENALPNVEVKMWTTCEEVLTTIVTYKYIAYIVDYNLVQAYVGPECVARIRLVVPNALIIGNSMVNDEFQEYVIRDFLRDGKTLFHNKLHGSSTLAEQLVKLIGK